jgi:hypothetical protein
MPGVMNEIRQPHQQDRGGAHFVASLFDALWHTPSTKQVHFGAKASIFVFAFYSPEV